MAKPNVTTQLESFPTIVPFQTSSKEDLTLGKSTCKSETPSMQTPPLSLPSQGAILEATPILIYYDEEGSPKSHTQSLVAPACPLAEEATLEETTEVELKPVLINLEDNSPNLTSK